jgi:hypothetical protein
VTRRIPLAAVTLAALLGCAASPGLKPNAGATATIADTDVGALLVRACFGCHTNEARRPWYAHLAPSSWTSTARDDLNFSDWPLYDQDRRRQALGAIAMTVQARTMPPADYTFFDHGVALADRERDALVRWASRQDLPTPPPPAF